MANKKISELDNIISLDGSEVLPIVKDGVTKKVSVTQIGANKANSDHNHNLADLSEKDYSSLDNKPDLDLKLDKESPTINGDLELLQSDKGIILKSVGGIRYRLTVDDNGNLETEAL